MKKVIITVAVFFSLFAAQNIAAHQPMISKGEQSCLGLLKKALTKKTFPKRALKDCPIGHKIILWRKYETPKSGATFNDIMQFINDNPQWPRLMLLQQRAEESLNSKTSPNQIIFWFEKYPPLTGIGTSQYITALEKSGSGSKAKSLIREAWRTKNFTQAQLKQFYKKFRKHLTRADHLSRLQKLGWDSNTFGLHGMQRYFSHDHRLLIQTLIALIKNRGSVDFHIKKLPQSLHSNPLFLFHRIKWRLKRNRIDSAYELFKTAVTKKADQIQPDAWLPIRRRFAREFIKQKKFQQAYDVIKNHHLSSGSKTAEAEWLAGWLALRCLNRADLAPPHLINFYHYAETPISKAKAAYWLGYTFEKLGDLEKSQHWYTIARNHPLTFFGQMAAETLAAKSEGPSNTMPLWHLKTAPSNAQDRDGFWQEMIEVLKILKTAKMSAYAKPFLIHLAKTVEADDDRELLVHAASTYAPQFAVIAAKIAGRKGSLSIKAAFPTLDKSHIPPQLSKQAKIPLLNAIIRQESGFDTHGISPAGARGLMQLMPRTARFVAKSTNIKLTGKEQLLSKPALNVRIGSSHITKLLHAFEGDVVLALASYNAGHGRVLRWIKEYGDPRKSETDILDWIEMIPYEETRTYIYRIMETLPIYEALHGAQKK